MALYLLDTNTVSYIVSARSHAARRRYADRQSSDRVAISAITEGEIRYGMVWRPLGAQKFAFMQRFLDTVESLPWDSSVTTAYGELRSQLSQIGRVLGALDLLIAAHAIAVGAVLVTHDQAFHRLGPQILQVQDWATDI